MKEKLRKIFNKENLTKKNILIASGVVVGIIIIVAIILVFSLGKHNQERELNKSMKNLGVDFYENFYYKQVGKSDEDRAKFVGKYEKLGIKVSLDNLARFKVKETEQILKEFVNEKTGRPCDKQNSRVIIYPKEPYGQKDYKIEVSLVCDFETTKPAKK